MWLIFSIRMDQSFVYSLFFCLKYIKFLVEDRAKKAFRYVFCLAEFPLVLPFSSWLRQYETGYCTQFKSSKHTCNRVSHFLKNKNIS